MPKAVVVTALVIVTMSVAVTGKLEKECDLTAAKIENCKTNIGRKPWRITQNTTISNAVIECQHKLFSSNKECISIFPGISLKMKEVELKGSFGRAGSRFIYMFDEAVLDMDTVEANSFTNGQLVHAQQDNQISIENSQFIGNNIRLLNLHYTNLTMVNTLIKNNKDTLISSIYSDITLSQCRFRGNVANHPILDLKSTYANFKGMNFVNNSCSSVIEIGDYSKVSITDSTFSSNEILKSGTILSGNSELNLTTTTFLDNHAMRFGGALFTRSKSIVNVVGCEFRFNSAESGGAIYISESTVLSIEKSKIVGNGAYEPHGHGILCNNSKIKMDKATDEKIDRSDYVYSCDVEN